VMLPTERRRKVLWRRIALWSIVGLMVVGLATGGGFYLWFRAQVGAANERVDPGVIQALGERNSSTSTTGSSQTPVEAPSGMNLVLLGSDARASLGKTGRTDSIILVHVDSEKNFLSMLSIPRDLYVAIAGHPPNRINAAYTFGGPALLIRTIQSTFGLDLDHYLEVDFNAFQQITDTVGGVYVDIDRTYNDQWIHFDPGYQLLNGTKALDYVRTRHDSNYDFGRMERQQRFIQAIREQAMGWNLPLKLPGLVKALFGNVDTDLTANEFLKLAYWGVKLDGGRMRLAKIVAGNQTVNGASVVVASPEQIQKAVKDFLTEPEPVPQDRDLLAPPSARIKTADLSDISVNIVNGTGRLGQGALAAVWLLRQGASVASIKETDDPVEGGAVVTYPQGRSDAAKAVALALGIGRTRQSGKSGRIMVTLGTTYGISGDDMPASAAAIGSGAGAAGSTESSAILNAKQWKTLAGKVKFSLAAPMFVPGGCAYSFQRSYNIAVGKKSKPAVRVGYQFGAKDRYMGLSETTWLDAPIASPGRRLTGPGGVVFTLVGSSTKSDHVWWSQDEVLRWVSNTLVFDLAREEMLAAAMSALPVQAARPSESPTTSQPPAS
jgi:LCP family protein required for cell wall assembly